MDPLLDLAPCGFFSFQDDGTIIRMNQTLKVMLGLSDVKPEGKSIDTILTIASRIFYNTHFFPLIRMQGKVDEIFLTLRGSNKVDVPVMVNAIRKPEGNILVNHCVVVAVHQRQKYEQEILAAKKQAEDATRRNEELNRLSAKLEDHARQLDNQYSRLFTMNQNLIQFNKIISHDLQEPIHKIQVFTDVLTMDSGHGLSARAQKAVKIIKASIEKMKQLTDGLDQFVQVDSQRNLTLVNMNDVIQKARVRAETARGITVAEFNCDSVPAIDGYETQLELLFCHLFDNAIQYRKPGVPLAIRIGATILEENVYKATSDRYRYTDHVRITFSDNGIGFDNQYKEHIFEMVSKIDISGKGLGLGLSLAKKIVDYHKGSIRAQSEPGKGATFVVTLPIQADADAMS